ncbi:MAG: hypothetical protein MZV64_64275 [Ignavibacteriales bacterium]|nr:hypothetical protein [Ignavibacteriales bacterium]
MPDIAAGNILGSCVFNVLILRAPRYAVEEGPTSPRINQANISCRRGCPCCSSAASRPSLFLGAPARARLGRALHAAPHRRLPGHHAHGLQVREDARLRPSGQGEERGRRPAMTLRGGRHPLRRPRGRRRRRGRLPALDRRAASPSHDRPRHRPSSATFSSPYPTSLPRAGRVHRCAEDRSRRHGRGQHLRQQHLQHVHPGHRGHVLFQGSAPVLCPGTALDPGPPGHGHDRPGQSPA